MALIKVGRTTQLPPESVMEVMVGEDPYAICHTGGTFRALSGVCPHAGGPLGQGQIHDGHLVCPYHMWEFDCSTGEYDFDPALRVATFEVTVENGEILLQIPNA